MPIFVGAGTIVSGKIQLYQQDEMDAIIGRKPDSEIELSIDVLHPLRTPAQNKYMWSVVVARCAVHLEMDSRVLCHQVLKAQFMDPHLVTSGEIPGWISPSGLILGTSTRKLSGVQFFDYLERICEHAAAHWGGLYIPPPDPLWRLHSHEELERRKRLLDEIPFDV